MFLMASLKHSKNCFNDQSLGFIILHFPFSLSILYNIVLISGIKWKGNDMNMDVSSFVKAFNEYEPGENLVVSRNQSFALRKDQDYLSYAKILSCAAESLKSLANSDVSSDQDNLLKLMVSLSNLRDELDSAMTLCLPLLNKSVSVFSNKFFDSFCKSRLRSKKESQIFPYYIKLSDTLKKHVLCFLSQRDLARFSSVDKSANKMLSESSDFWEEWRGKISPSYKISVKTDMNGLKVSTSERSPKEAVLCEVEFAQWFHLLNTASISCSKPEYSESKTDVFKLLDDLFVSLFEKKMTFFYEKKIHMASKYKELIQILSNNAQSILEISCISRKILLPSTINLLKDLHSIHLVECHLSELPNLILPNLTSLILRFNFLTSLPRIDLPKIDTLILCGNNFTSIPSSIFKLSTLTYLDFSANHIMNLPIEIANLNSLQIVNLEHNELTRIPNTIGKIKSLEKFYLGNNRLTCIPEEISQLKNLKTLTLHGNPGLSLDIFAIRGIPVVHYDPDIESLV